MTPADPPASRFAPSLSRTRHLLWRYAFAFLAVAVATSIRYALGRFWGVIPPYITFYPIVMLVAILAGLGPSLLATFLSAVTADFFFLEPRGSFFIVAHGDRIAMAVFIVTCASICLLAEAMRHRDLELVHTRSALERAHDQSLLAAIVDSAEDAIIRKDLHAIIQTWNPSAERLFGYAASEVIGQPVTLLIPPGLEHEETAIRQRFSTGQPTDHFESVRKRKNGTLFNVSLTISPIKDPVGNIIGASTIIRDITERLRMEKELELNRAQAVSSARLSALGLMAGSVAHEINNPLAVIHASASNLLELADSQNVPLDSLLTAASRIKKTAQRISRIVMSLRQISREGAADSFQPASVAEIVQQALALCEERFRVYSVRLDAPPVDPTLFISCREVQIAQVLLNLLQNAFDAVVDLESDKWVRLEVSTHNHSVVFSLSDSGPGVPSELKSRIMDPFFTTKPVGKGTGLGLSLSKAMVEEHGGELKLIESSPQTTFSFSIPLLMEETHAIPGRYNIARR
jgi:PAS domain S-box-containing protein